MLLLLLLLEDDEEGDEAMRPCTCPCFSAFSAFLFKRTRTLSNDGTPKKASAGNKVLPHSLSIYVRVVVLIGCG